MKQLSKEERAWLLANLSPPKRKSWIQDDFLKTWKANNFIGTFEAATGVGKTRPAVLATAQCIMNDPQALVYILVPTETLRDVGWKEEFTKWGFPELYDQVKIICHASMDNEVAERDIDLVIFDEIHHMTVKNSSFFNRNKCFNRLGLTATKPKSSRNENDAMKSDLIDQMFPVLYKISVETAIELELVSDFSVEVALFDLDNRDFYVEGGTKTKKVMKTEKLQYEYLTKMLQKCMYSPKLAGAKFKWMGDRTRFLKNLRSKTKLAKQIMDLIIKPENRTLIFAGSIAQCNELGGKQVYHSESSDEQLIQFRNKEIYYLVAVNALNEGENIEDLDQSIIVQLDSNSRSVIQRIGRNIRFREDHKARIIILVAKDTADEKWYRAAFADFDKSRIKEYYIKLEEK